MDQFGTSKLRQIVSHTPAPGNVGDVETFMFKVFVYAGFQQTLDIRQTLDIGHTRLWTWQIMNVLNIRLDKWIQCYIYPIQYQK